MADITYLPTAGRIVYQSLVTDAHSRKIVGWHVRERLQTEEVALAAPDPPAPSTPLHAARPSAA